MQTYSKNELEEARFAIHSTINKCEKSLQKLLDKSSQKTLLTRRVKALKISLELIDNTLLNLTTNDEQETTNR